MILIVDTNVLIDFTRSKRPVWPTIVRLAKAEGHQLVTPSVAVFEFLAGSEMNSESNRRKASNILSDVTVLDVSRKIAETAASLFRLYKAPIGVIDYLLAATAIVHSGELVTLNVKHFRTMSEVRLFNTTRITH